MKKINYLLLAFVLLFSGLMTVKAEDFTVDDVIAKYNVLELFDEEVLTSRLEKDGANLKATTTSPFGENIESKLTVNGDVISYKYELAEGEEYNAIKAINDGISVVGVGYAVGLLQAYTEDELDRFFDQEDYDQYTLEDHGFMLKRETITSEEATITYVSEFKIDINKFNVEIPVAKELKIDARLVNNKVVIRGTYEDDTAVCGVYKSRDEDDFEKIGTFNCNDEYLDIHVDYDVPYYYYIATEKSPRDESNVLRVVLSLKEDEQVEETESNQVTVIGGSVVDDSKEDKVIEEVKNPKTGVEDHILTGLLILVGGTSLLLGLRRKDLFRQI